MKEYLKFSLFTLIIVVFGIRSFSQNTELEKVKVKFIIDSLLYDTTYALGPWGIKLVYNLADSIEKYGFRKDKIFPFRDYKKVKLFKANHEKRLVRSCLNENTMTLNDFVDRKGKKLSIDQTERLLNIINNPLAFGWSMQETQVLKAGIVFYDEQNEIIACINIFNDGKQLGFFPREIRTKEGQLKKHDGQKFIELLIELGLDFY